ncbi:tetratricopeptide repeat protein [Aureliella helgolandensis]|uniref:Tetratricopeptide repeat protein n=1 Tax=Aureliella helgolandensis TaxID=2527968 RepID=A0A518GGP4_9BACT|nr:tetratricopeptide repeat protein [Aureliella helgolandensis]QDV27766.1 tetratricopeptide repeat protein [Aureliella helgolandensis]
MKPKQFWLACATAVLVGVACLAFIRPTSPQAERDGAQRQAPPSGAAPSAASPRPAFTLPERPAGLQANRPLQQQCEDSSKASIASLHNLTFDLAEGTVGHLPNSPAAFSLLGRLHLRSGSSTNARLLWEQAMAVAPKSPEPHIDFGFLELKLGHAEEAEAHFRRAAELDPHSLDALDGLTEALLLQAKYAEARDPLKTLVQRSPEAYAAWCRLGEVQLKLQEATLAKDSFDRALKIRGKGREALHGLIKTTAQLDDRARSEELIEVLSELDATESQNSIDRDEIDHERAAYLLQTTAQSLSELLYQQRQPSASVQILELAYDALPSAPLRGLLTAAYLRQGQTDQAIGLLENECEDRPDESSLWSELALLYMQTRRLDEAEAALRQYIRLTPESGEAYALLAQTQLPAGRSPQAAVESAQRAVELSPIAGHHYILGTALYHAGRLTESKLELTRAVELAPTNQEFRRALSSIE